MKAFAFQHQSKKHIIPGVLIYRDQLDIFGNEALVFATEKNYIIVIKPIEERETASKITTVEKYKLRNGNRRKFLFWTWTEKPHRYLDRAIETNEWNHKAQDIAIAIADHLGDKELSKHFQTVHA